MITRLMTALCITVLLAAAAPAPTPAPAPALLDRLKPWDEAAQDPSFVAFRRKLQHIVERKDIAGLKASLAPDILNNFGGGKGFAAFDNAWKLHDPHSAVWPALAGVLKLGGYFDRKTAFSAPYVFAAWPNDLDSFNYVAVTTADAVIRKAADAKSAIVRKLDYDLIEVIRSDGRPQHEAGPDDWAEVKDRKGNHGFILVRDVRSPLDFRATFEKRAGKWLVASFVSGE